MSDLLVADGAWDIAFESFAVRVGVSTDDPRLGARLRELPSNQARSCDGVDHHFSITTPEGTRFNVLYDLRDGEAATDLASYVASDVDVELALELLDAHVHECIALYAPEHVFIHGGAVAYKGSAILLPGKGITGRTTLVRALVRAGASYYSDEYAVLDEEGLLHPYGRAASLAAVVAPDEEGYDGVAAQSAGLVPLPVGGVVGTAYRPGAEWDPRGLTRAEGVLALLSHAVPAQERPDQTMRAVASAVDRGPVMLQGERGDAETVAPLLLAELERAPSVGI